MIHLNSDRPITTTEFIVHSLSQDILNGNIKSGSKLKQNEISKRFNVSATPVREALKILTAKGLISFDPFKGAIVKGLCYKEAKEIYENLPENSFNHPYEACKKSDSNSKYFFFLH